MQALSMIDMGSQSPEINTPHKAAELQDKPFSHVLNAQQQPGKDATQKTATKSKAEAGAKVEPKAKEGSTDKAKPEAKESSTAKAKSEAKESGTAKAKPEAKATARDTAEPKVQKQKPEAGVTQQSKPSQAPAKGVETAPHPAEDNTLSDGQEKIQHLLIDLLQTLAAAANSRQSAQQQGAKSATAKGQLAQLVQQLNGSKTEGESVQLGTDLAAQIEQLRNQLQQQDKDQNSPLELLTQLVQQLDGSDLKGEQVLAGVDLSPLVEKLQQLKKQNDGDDALTQLVAQLAQQLANQTSQDVNNEPVAGKSQAPAVPGSADAADSLGRVRQMLQQAIDAVADQQSTTEAEVATDQQPQLEEAHPDHQGKKEEIDPRFAGLLKPRQNGLTLPSLRERVQAQAGGAQATQAIAADQAADAAAQVKPQQSKVETSDALNNAPKQAVDNLLHQLQGSQQQGQQQAAPGSARPMPPATPMLQLPSGQEVAESQIFDQVVARMSGSFNGESGRMVLRLQPAELGSLKLELKVEGDRLQAHLQAQSHQVQEVLQRNLPHLRNALAEQGLKIDRFHVDVDQRNGQQHQFDNPTQQQHNQGSRRQQPWQQGWQQEEQIIPLSQLMQNNVGGISLRV